MAISGHEPRHHQTSTNVPSCASRKHEQTIVKATCQISINYKRIKNFSISALQASFGQSLDLLKLSSTEVVVLRRTWEMLVAALGNDREAVGDALYGALTGALLALHSHFVTPKARHSSSLQGAFNGWFQPFLMAGFLDAYGWFKFSMKYLRCFCF